MSVSYNGNISLSDWQAHYLCLSAPNRYLMNKKAHYKNKKKRDKGLPISWASCVVAAL